MGEMNYRIQVASGENTLVFSPVSPLRLLADGLKGFDMADFDVSFGYAADGRGAFVKGCRFCERELEFCFEIGENDGMWRGMIRSVASPGKECVITVDLGGVCRRIMAIPLGKAVFERKTLCARTVVILRFAACSPFFGGDMIVAEGTDLHLMNEGEVPCGAVFRICAEGGEVVNPWVSCGDSSVWVKAVLSDGDAVVIDTRSGKKGVWLNGDECQLFDWTSRFFSLDVGDNVLSADADSGKEFMAVHVEVVPLYYGV